MANFRHFSECESFRFDGIHFDHWQCGVIRKLLGKVHEQMESQFQSHIYCSWTSKVLVTEGDLVSMFIWVCLKRWCPWVPQTQWIIIIFHAPCCLGMFGGIHPILRQNKMCPWGNPCIFLWIFIPSSSSHLPIDPIGHESTVKKQRMLWYSRHLYYKKKN